VKLVRLVGYEQCMTGRISRKEKFLPWSRKRTSDGWRKWWWWKWWRSVFEMEWKRRRM